MSSIELETEPVEEVLDDDERERFTHIVLEALKLPSGEVQALSNSVVEGTIYGTPVRALCGKVWVPGRDPRRYLLCPTCKEIAEHAGWKVPAH